jgi:small subunit ribosomal protein S21
MISIDVKKFKSLDAALKAYKNKHNKIGIVKELRDRQTYIKPSIERRTEILKAKYIESKRTK